MAARKAVQDAEVASKTIEKKGLLIVNTGPGKGKSTAAFGLILRALGNGWRVGVVQFIKGAWDTGEKRALEAFGDRVVWKAMGEGFTWETQDRERDVAAAERAFAVRDAPTGFRSVDQYLTMYRARNVRQLAAALSKFQAAGFNTTAVDAGGEAFYGDIGPLPYVTDAKAEACSVSDLARTAWKTTRVPVLDGSRSACD
eukprot:gene57151-76317_t